MRIFDAAAMLSEELHAFPTLRIVFSFKDGTRMLVGKSSGTESDPCALRAHPNAASPEVIEVEGFACDQAGNLLPDAKKMQRFFPADLIAGFDLIEAHPKTLARVRQALFGQGEHSSAAQPPARREPAPAKAGAPSPEQSHLRMAEDGPSGK
ncbi:MAG: hypothetical protein ABSA67_16075 [Candidatus Brocadiia bacterium]|jgi:hypothetical protein